MLHSFADDAKSNCEQSDDSSTNHRWLAIGTTKDWECDEDMKRKMKIHADSLTAVLRCLHYYFFFLFMFFKWQSGGAFRGSVKGVRLCCLHTGIPHSATANAGGRRPPYGRNVCFWWAAIDDELRKYSTMKRPLWRMLSDLLGWGNWKALDRSPWSPLTFIKGSGLHSKIVGLFLSVSFYL